MEFNPNGASGGTCPADMPERPRNIYQQVLQAFPVMPE